MRTLQSRLRAEPRLAALVLAASCALASGCGKNKTKRPVEAAGSSSASSATQTASVPSAPVVSPTPPTTFDDGRSVTLVNSQAAGCAARANQGWVEVVCEPENETKGKVSKVTVHEGLPPGASEDGVPGADGRMRFVLPWQPGKRGRATLEWSDAVFELTTSNQRGGFTRVLPEAQGRVCAELTRAYAERIKKVRDSETKAALGAADVRKFPKLAECEVVGGDAWALEVADIAAVGEGPDREVSLTLNVVHVDKAGSVAKAVWGPISFAPASVAIPDPVLFDYDSDGVSEVIVRHDILARGAVSTRKPLTKLPAVFTFKKGRVTAYPAASALGVGGAVAENLEGDGRPDPGDYGPYLGWFGAECGVGPCPQRVTGPRFYQRSLPDGSFDSAAVEVTAALRQGCSRSRGSLVVDVGSVTGKTRTALNVACARVRGEAPEAVLDALNREKSQLCGDAAECPLHALLTSWAKAEPPRKLVLPDKE